MLRLVATTAGRQPAFGLYLRDPHTGVFRASGLPAITLTGDRAA